MSATTTDSNTSSPKIAEVLFDLLHIEIINHFRSQRDIQPYLDSGIDYQQAQATIQRIIFDQVLTMGQHIGQKLTLKLLQDNPVANLPQGVENAPLKFIGGQLWNHLFGKVADFQVVDKGTFVIRESNLRWISRFSPTPDSLNEHIKPYTWLLTGIIKGAFTAMHVQCDVTEQIELRKEQVHLLFKIEEQYRLMQSL